MKAIEMMMAYNNNQNNFPFGNNNLNSSNNNNNCNGEQVFDSFQQVQGKLDCSNNFMVANGLAAQMQTGFLNQQFFNNNNGNGNGMGSFCNANNNNCNGNGMQSNFGFSKMQPTLNFQNSNNNGAMVGCSNNNNNQFLNQCNNLNNNGNNNSCLSNLNNSMASFQPSSTLMNAMNMTLNMQQQQQQQAFFAGNNFGCSQVPSLALSQAQQLNNGIPAFITTTTTICNNNNNNDSSTHTTSRVTPPSIPAFMGSSSTTTPAAVIDVDGEDTTSALLEPLNTFPASAPAATKAERRTSESPAVDDSIHQDNLPRSISKTKRLLPADFEPTSTSIICGNKRKYFESKGNMRFRSVCDMFTQDYATAPTKIEKSAVVSKVMNILREDCIDGVCFVSPQNGRWYAVSERTAREKVGTYLRDCLSGHYLSSAKNKIARRKMTKKELSGSSTTSSTTSSPIIPLTTTPVPAPAAFAGANNNDNDDGSLDSVSFYDVDDLTPVPL